MILQKLRQVLNNECGGACLHVLFKPLVNADDVHKLMGQVVFRTDSRLQRYGGTNINRRHRQNLQDHPFRPCHVGVEP